ncbi:molybdenum cofactor synthesis protein cinnamon-like [Episyrphus balteatus]|uniref:molybdenum cofactor synthesis protein cinnamon-like n=1 Tax=Episyrphus balteatus TaxID=286459 RepID=UPI00248533EA|nr:molybdenum cofactor synthesis protein cinnamon-like [Episyrphus balteatus]
MRVSDYELQEDECFKINTGAPIPNHADCVIQIEDTKLLRTTKQGNEDLVEILVEPKANLDIRPIGCDLRKGTQLFPSADHSEVVVKSILASVGKTIQFKKPKIAVISTGSELLAPDDVEVSGKIYDSNTTMLEELLAYFNFDCMMKSVLRDDFESLKAAVEEIYQSVDFIICSGGVSMGDKDYIKPVLEKLGFQINFGRINMKPGKPMTFASNTSNGKYFFGLPGNPVSAFVTFHLFALPVIRWASGWERDKCELATIQVTLQNDNIDLDPRPEYVRASVTSKNGRLYASVNGNQISSRLQSIIGADVLVHLPGKTPEKPVASAGDILRASVSDYELQEDECFKINTGAPIPNHADCVIQIEDTKLLRTTKQGNEDLVEILVEPKANLDIRPIGCDLRKGTQLFPSADHSEVVVKSILASVGKTIQFKKPKIAVISTGSELLAPDDVEVSGKIYDSNTTMLEELLAYFNFDCMMKSVLRDDFESLKAAVEEIYQSVDFIICSGGVSMGDKDYIKPVLEKLGFQINFGRINMKPGKPMTFASNTSNGKYFFGLPGNPVSAFVTFHLFALPVIRWASGWERDKCELATIQVTLQNDNIDLDPRPEYVRASVTSKNGRLYASVNGNQISSRLQSIIGADVLVHLPGKTPEKPVASAGDILRASVLRYDFISKYE